MAEREQRGAAAEPLPVADAREAAARAGLRAGDCIVSVNGEPARDVLDLESAAADEVLWLRVLRDGHPLELAVRPRKGEWHGISLGWGGLGAGPRTCRNACRFCFVDQLPPGLRPEVYVKDDDYRLSFLHGNFTTLTNLDEADLARIEELRLSPLYVSLHAWDDAARVRLMGRAAGGSRAALQRLAAAGVELHLQVVLCPGWNDGDVLAETVARTAALPAVADLGIVPVSLAVEGDLRRVTPAAAGALVDQVVAWQKRYIGERGVAFVHAADELWLLSGRMPPASDAPEQYENGIGMAGVLVEEALTVRETPQQPGTWPDGVRMVRLLCGTLARPVVQDVAATLGRALGLPVRSFPVRNRLFGDHVTVTGLLGGAEIISVLGDDPLADGEWLVAPRVFLPEALGETLDGVGEKELAAACDGRLVLAGSLGEAFARLTG